MGQSLVLVTLDPDLPQLELLELVCIVLWTYEEPEDAYISPLSR